MQRWEPLPEAVENNAGRMVRVVERVVQEDKAMYMIVTNDDYELPVAVFDTRQEVADYLHISVAAVANRLHRGVKKKYTEKIMSVSEEICMAERMREEKRYQAAYRRTYDRSEYFLQRYQRRKKEALSNA